jgi:C-terminal processing protease CtpA/Prc
MRHTVVAFLAILLLSVPAAAEEQAAAKHAYFGFAFHYKYDQSPMQLGVCAVRADMPAGKAGLKLDDRIVAVDGRSDFRNSLGVLMYLSTKQPGDKLILTIRGEKDVTVEVAGIEATEEQVAGMRRNLDRAREEAESHQ